MSLLCVCPLPAALGDISAITCAQNLGQIQKIAFQRRNSVAAFPTQDNQALGAAVLASWTTLLAAVDDDHVVVSPFFEAHVIPPAEAILDGGDDNTTVDGAPITVGATTPRVEAMFRGLPASILKELHALSCELDLTAYLINEAGKIIGFSADGTTFAGIPIISFFVGSPGSEGKNTHDKTPFGYSLKDNWADDLAIVTPDDFNALTDLI